MSAHALTGAVTREIEREMISFAFDFNAQCELEAKFNQTTDQIFARLLMMAATVETERPRYDKSLIRGVIWAAGLEGMKGWTLRDAGKYCQSLGDQEAANLAGELWDGSGLLDVLKDGADKGDAAGNGPAPGAAAE